MEILTRERAGAVLSLFPEGARISGARFYQEEYLPCPAFVEVELANGEMRTVIIRFSRIGISTLERECDIYSVLRENGLSVPEVLIPPKMGVDGVPFAVVAQLPGQNVQMLAETPGADVARASAMLLDAFDRLHSLTGAVRRSRPGRRLETHSLADELSDYYADPKGWDAHPEVRRALALLNRVLPRIQTPAVFSNGDKNPANFLTDGGKVTGYIDFEHACFEDPHYGVAKYEVYDIAPFTRAGFVPAYLERAGISEVEFSPRLAVRALWTLRREVNPTGLDDQTYRAATLTVLARANNLMEVF